VLCCAVVYRVSLTCIQNQPFFMAHAASSFDIMPWVRSVAPELALAQ
jgi:hypothetical protein